MTEFDQDPQLEVAESLGRFSHAALKTMSSKLGVAHPTGESADKLETLARFIGTPEHRAILRQQLTRDDWALLDRIIPLLGPVTLRFFLVPLIERGMDRDSAVRAISKLFACGCILPRSEMYGTMRLGLDPGSLVSSGLQMWFTVPTPILRWATEESGKSRVLAPSPAPAAVAESTVPDFRRALFVLFQEIRQRPLRTTIQGSVNRTDLNRIATAFSGPPPRGAKRTPNAALTSPLFWFSLGTLFTSSLLDEDSADISLDETALSFFQSSSTEQARILLSAWTGSPFNDFGRIPTLELQPGIDQSNWLSPQIYLPYGLTEDRLTSARTLLVSTLQIGVFKDLDAWYRIDDLARLIFEESSEFLFPRLSDYELFPNAYVWGRAKTEQRKQYPGIARKGAAAGKAALFQDTDWMEVEGALVRQIFVDALRWLGIVEVGLNGDQPVAFRLTDLGRAALFATTDAEPETGTSRAIVQPSFEIVITDAAASLGLLGQIEEFAERRSLDRAATYRLTQSALVNGLDRGWTGRRIIETLESATGGHLPQNVRFTIEDWTRIYERLSLRESATLFEADDERQLQVLLSDRQLAPLLGQRLGPTSVLIASRNVEAAVKRIERLINPISKIDYGEPPAISLKLREPDLIELDVSKAESYLCYRLEQFSVPIQKVDGQIIYRVNAESAARARADGLKGTQTVEFLANRSGEPIPIDFLTRLLGWGGSIGTLAAEPLIAVHLPRGPVQWDQIRQIPDVGRWIRAIPTTHLALVSPSDVEALRSALNERGIEMAEARIAEKMIGDSTTENRLRAALAETAGDAGRLVDELRKLGLLAKIDQERKRRQSPWATILNDQ